MSELGPKRFIECLLPVSACNLKCDYCYIIQENKRSNLVPSLKYSPEKMRAALSKKRLGGVCYFSICGAGETLIPDYAVKIVHELLLEGHYVNITTNGTLTNRFLQLISFDKELLTHLHFAFSFHYLELKRRNLIDVFFENVSLVKKAGCSILIQFNLYDGYIPFLKEIKDICLKKVGALPQVAATRDESTRPMKLYTSLSAKEYLKIGKEFDSPLFEFTMKNFNIKRKEFCYAGDWSFVLNLETGVMNKCYANTEGSQNIFDNPNEPIKFEAVGKNCKNCYCVNSSHFLSLGVIPSISTPTYEALRNRKMVGWYTSVMQQFLSKKLVDNNKKYTGKQKKIISRKYKKSLFFKFKKLAKKILSLTKKSFVFFFRFYKISHNYCYFIPQHEHTNIGDAAIAMSQFEILEKTGFKVLEVSVNDFNRYKSFFKRFLNSKKRYYALQGGGNMGNVWPILEIYRRNVIKLLDKSNIIIYPQTIFYKESNDLCSCFDSVGYYNNSRITIFVRENFSFELAKKIYPDAKVFLVPDTVLISHDYVNKEAKKRKGVLFVLRSDAEKNPDNNKIIFAAKKAVEQLGLDIIETDMHNDSVINPKNRKKVVQTKLNEFKTAEIVITDRLHGMIFSAITNTPCLVLENNNYKILGSYEWIKNINGIELLCQTNNLNDKIATISSKKPNIDSLELNRFINYFKIK